jgi:hypothetical protein
MYAKRAEIQESLYIDAPLQQGPPRLPAGIAVDTVDCGCMSSRNNPQEPKRQKGLSRPYNWTDDRSVSFWWLLLPDAVSVREFVIEPPGRFFSSKSAVRNGRYLTEENFHEKIR